MYNDRREFLRSAGAIAITSALLPGGVLAETIIGPVTVHSRKGFQARVNDWFYLHNSDASHQCNLELANVADTGSNDKVEQFALTLRSDLQATPMPSGYYYVAGEPFNLFVKHTHEQDGRQFYRAEFALLKKQSRPILRSPRPLRRPSRPMVRSSRPIRESWARNLD